MLLMVSTSIPRTGSIGGGAPFLSVKVGVLSHPAFESGGAWLAALVYAQCSTRLCHSIGYSSYL